MQSGVNGEGRFDPLIAPYHGRWTTNTHQSPCAFLFHNSGLQWIGFFGGHSGEIGATYQHLGAATPAGATLETTQGGHG